MAWAKFDDRWATHPKLLAAGLEAKGLDASGICYCAGQETDGFVPDSALVILAAGHRNPRRVAERLIEVGRWSRDEERKGYVIHDFELYNFTRAQGEAKRLRDAERKAQARARQGRDANGRITSGQTDEEVRADTDERPPGFHEESARTPTPVPPVPTRPDPTPSVNKSSSSLDRVGPDGADDDESRVQRAKAAIVERRIGALSEPPKNPRAYRLRVIGNVEEEQGDDIERLVAEGRSVESIADELCPVAPLAVSTSPAHAKWEPNQPTGPSTPAEERAARLAELRQGTRVG